MPKDVSIAELMVKDHEKIASLLERLESDMRDKAVDTKAAFNKFKWELERHFVVEEKAVFAEIRSTDEGYKLSEVIVKEHRIIWDMVEDVEGKMDIGGSDISGLKDVLFKHKRMEDKTLYPMLDRSLSLEKKKAIMNRIENPI